MYQRHTYIQKLVRYTYISSSYNHLMEYDLIVNSVYGQGAIMSINMLR